MKTISQQDSDKIATRQRQDSVTFRNAIARKIDTQENKYETGHRQDRENRATSGTTSRKTGTGY